MKKVPKIFDLVVLDHEPGATMNRVTEVGRREVGVIDATIEDTQPNQRIKWIDISLLQQPTLGQLAAFNH